MIEMTPKAQILFDRATPFHRKFIRAFCKWLEETKQTRKFNRAKRQQRRELIKTFGKVYHDHI